MYKKAWMMKRVLFVAGSVLLGVLLTTASGSAAASGGSIENRGQLDQAVRYYAPGARATVYFTGDGLVFDLKEEIPAQHGRDLDRFGGPGKIAEPEEPASRRGCAVYLRFEGANSAARVETRRQLAARYNYFLGCDPAGWHVDVPAFAEVVYRDLWPGADLVWREETGSLTYEILALVPGGQR